MPEKNAGRWGIIGGGILGMTLAHRLASRIGSVVLFERAEKVGGLAAAWQLGPVEWDRHYHVILLSDMELRNLLGELNLADQVDWVTTRTGFFTDGQLYSMSNSWEFLRFPPLGLWNKARLAATIIHASRIRNWQELENIPAIDWLRRWSGRRTTERIWLPLLRAKLGENATRVSAAFIWAIIARMYAARRTGLKKEMFGYVRGGYANILHRFEEKLLDQGIEIRLNARVRSVAGANGQVEVVTEEGASEIFDRVIVTAPGPVAAQMIPGLNLREREGWNKIAYQGIICASLLLKKPLAGYYVTNITDPEVPFTAVIEMSALVDRSAFGGHNLVYLPKYVAPDDPAFGLSDAEIEDRFVGALARMYDDFSRDQVLAFRVSRVRHVLALATLHYSEQLPPMQTSVPGVWIVNSAHIVNGTLNVNETIQLADRALAQLLAATGSSTKPLADAVS